MSGSAGKRAAACDGPHCCRRGRPDSSARACSQTGQWQRRSACAQQHDAAASTEAKAGAVIDSARSAANALPESRSARLIVGILVRLLLRGSPARHEIDESARLFPPVRFRTSK
jgi:hypothetical protein